MPIKLQFPFLVFSILCTVVLFASCQINGSFHGLFSYYNNSYKAKPALFENLKTEVCQLRNADTPKVYIINGKQLATCISQYKKCMIYKWTPRCHSRVCVSLNYMEELCEKNQVELFVVAEYYDLFFMDNHYATKRPVFGVDTKYYRSNLTNKYMRRFFNDIDKSINPVEFRFFYFENGKCIDCSGDVELIKALKK